MIDGDIFEIDRWYLFVFGFYYIFRVVCNLYIVKFIDCSYIVSIELIIIVKRIFFFFFKIIIYNGRVLN